MAKKRANNEGTILKRKTCPNPDCRKMTAAADERRLKTCPHCGTALPAEGTWIAQITVGRDPVTGKLKRVTFSGKTRQEVQEKLTAALAQIQQGTFVEPSKVTVGEWLDTWLNEYKKPPRIRLTTWRGYEMVIRCHIKPAIGHIPLRQL